MTRCLKTLLVPGILLAAALAWWTAGAGRSQEARPETLQGFAVPKPAPTKKFYGVSNCSNCHTTPPQGAPPVLCRCTEFPIWIKEDKHKDAYKVLLGDRAKRMGEILGVKDGVHADKRCLSCHGVYIENPNQKDESFKAEDGVSCVVCHGPYGEWIDYHGGTRKADWRKISRKDKERYFGMLDLWDPVRRTKLCASCHVGSSEEGKVLTHDMYAAGHPPLPGFEVTTFSDFMPRHWELLSEKKPEVQKLLEYDSSKLEQTRLTLVGGLSAFREAMQLLAVEAESAANPKDSGPGVLDFAHFDCYACHHDLKTPSFRQDRGYVGRPGRPQARPWPLPLASLAARHAGEKDINLNEKLTPLWMAFDAQPFGKPDQVAASARDVVKWADGLLSKLDKADFNQASLTPLLKDLTNLGPRDLPDYDAARQIVWAFRVIYGDYKPKPANADKVAAVLDSLEKELKLTLPYGQKRFIEGEYKEALDRISEYDPYKFKKRIAELRALLPEK